MEDRMTKLVDILERVKQGESPYWAFYEAGKTAGAVDRFLGQRSPAAEASPLPGYKDGYKDGLRGER
jgi:hypothetical protein